jgi:ATP-dependent helicase/nuclease subunit A
MDRADRPPVLTDQQRRPLGVADSSVALSAGAGCGKTAVLTARFLGDLDGNDRRPLREIVALTFTEKAARELRQRIRNQCRAKLAEGEDPAHWRAVLRGLEAAPIGTFHEFCVRWLRRHAIEAKIDPDFNVLDESIAVTLRDEALRKCLRHWLSDSEDDLVELAVEYGLRRVRESLLSLLSQRSLGEIDAWAGKTPGELIDLWREKWANEGRKARFHKVLRAARACLEALAPHEPTHQVMRQRRAFLLERLPVLDQLVPSDAWLGEVPEMAKVQGGGTKKHWASEDIYEKVRDTLKELRDSIEDFLKKVQWDEEITRQAAEHGLRFARLASKARREYDEAKRARGLLDFDDLILKTRALLGAEPDTIGREPKESIARLLVDEFQDTDPVQSEILERLVGDGFGRGRLFLVGDFKQSIYRFRGAQPGIFQEFHDRFPADGQLALTENFRSVPGVLDFVNALFAEAFQPSSRLLPRRDELGDEPAVEFLWAVETDHETPGGKTSVSDRRKVEARWIARRIQQMIGSGRLIRDMKTGQMRPVQLRDVVLLFRSMTDTSAYEAALNEEGLDYYVMGGSAFYAQQEIHDLINLLSVIEDPRDAVSMTGALRSPFFGLSDEGLFWLATSKHGELADGLERVEEIEELSPDDRRQALRARTLLQRWRAIKDRTTIAALVDCVLSESGYEPALLGEFLGERKRANVRKLVRQAREFDQQGGFTIAEFVTRLRASLRETPREEQAATTDEEGTSIRLMSIHQAKGLEFPVVVLPDLNRKRPGKLDPVAFHPVLGPLVRPSRDLAAESDEPESGQSLGWLTYQALERRDEDDEALRLFYVATTRARDLLILSDGLESSGKLGSPAMSLLAERFDRRTGECRAPLPDGWPAPRVAVIRECPPGGEDEGGVCLPPSPLAGEGERADPPMSRRGARRSPLDEIAQAITAAPLPPERGSPAASYRPRFVDLDPARGLSPRAARLDRLVRTILADPKLFQPGQLPAIAARAARRQDPLATPSLVAEAIDRLRPWLEGPFGRELAASTAIERDLDWTVAWPPDSSHPTVYEGGIDLLARDREGSWRLILVSDASSSEAHERVRLLLSSHVANTLGHGPIRQGWSLRLGPGGGLSVEDRFEPDDIEEAILRSLHPDRQSS